MEKGDKTIKSAKTKLCTVTLNELAEDTDEFQLEIVIRHSGPEGWTEDEFLEYGFLVSVESETITQLEAACSNAKEVTEVFDDLGNVAVICIRFLDLEGAKTDFDSAISAIESLENYYESQLENNFQSQAHDLYEQLVRLPAPAKAIFLEKARLAKI